MTRRVLAVAALCLALATAGIVPARATAPTTRCAFGGGAGTSRVMRLHLPNGTDFLNLTMTSTRPPKPAAGAESWHLASGVFLLGESTRDLLAYRIESQGSATRRTVVERDGTRHADLASPGPDAPFTHSDLRSTQEGLPPGDYLLVAFGSDGDASAADGNVWSGFVEVGGDVSCDILESGQLFDVNQNDFAGGSQVSTFGASVVEEASLARELSGDLVVGLMDASTQVLGEATLDYAFPAGVTGTVDDQIVPFVSTGGGHSWTASASGASPIVSVVGLQIILP